MEIPHKRIQCHLHTVSTDNIQSQIILNDAFVFRKYPLVALLENQVHRLVVPFQTPLQMKHMFRHHARSENDATGHVLTTIFLPSLVITLTVSKEHTNLRRQQRQLRKT